MKKSIIALAIATSVAGVAQADTTLYGSVRLSVEYTDQGDVDSTDVTNNSSRWGIKGHEDLGNGLSAFYKYEFGIKADDLESVNNGGRLAYVGLKGGFGAVALGRQWSPYYNVAGYNDIFNGSFSYDKTYLGKFRLSDVVSYTTPEMGGFQVQAALIANGAGGDDEHLDAYNISVSYDNSGIFAGLSYLSTNGRADEDTLLGGTLGYTNENFRIGLVAEYADDGSDNNPLAVNIAGEYYINDKDLVRAFVGMEDRDIDNVDEELHAAIGYEHNFSKRTRVWAEYSYFDDGVDNSDSESILSVGLRTDF